MTKDVIKTKSKRATNTRILERMALIDEYLNILPTLDDCPTYFNLDEWKTIQEKGIDVKQLHTVMCGKVTNSMDLGILGEKLTVANFQSQLKKHDYDWNPYVHSLIPNETLVTLQCIVSYFKSVSSIKIHLNSILDADPNMPDDKFCVSLYFKDFKYTSAIAEHLYDLFSDRILGIVPGVGMIQIYVSQPIRARNIQKALVSLINDSVYKGKEITI